MNEWIMKMWTIHTMKYSSANKKKEIFSNSRNRKYNIYMKAQRL